MKHELLSLDDRTKFIYDSNTMSLSTSVDGTPFYFFKNDGVILHDIRKSSNIKIITMQVTDKCNLNCVYCYVEGIHSAITQMTGEKQLPFDELCELVLKIAPVESTPSIAINFLGGEPTIKMDFIYKFVEWAENTWESVKFGITTNGTRFNREYRNFFVEHNFGITVSLDGGKDMHDKNRVTRYGTGTYDKIINAITKLNFIDSNGNPIIKIRSTYSLVDDPDDILVRLLRQGMELTEKKLIKSFSMANCYDGELTEEVKDKIISKYRLAARWYVDTSRRKPLLWNDVIIKLLAPFMLKKPANTPCGAGVQYMTVKQSGDIYACHRIGKTKIAFDGEQFDKEELDKWLKTSSASNSVCSTCEIKGICPGHCRYQAIEHGSEDPYDVECFERKVQVRTLLYVMYELKDLLLPHVKNK